MIVVDRSKSTYIIDNAGIVVRCRTSRQIRYPLTVNLSSNSGAYYVRH